MNVEFTRTSASRRSEAKSGPDIVWKMVLFYIHLHIGALYGVYMCLSGEVMWPTILWSWLLYTLSKLGITAGAHRLWSHKSFKAKKPLRILLVVLQTLAFQNSIYQWCKDHRLHHKFTDTDADPHSIRRGFFFAHMGWLMCRKHPEVKEKRSQIDLADLEQDPVVMFQRKHYLPLLLVISVVGPLVVPCICWNESIAAAWLVAILLRIVITLHVTWSVNSVAHLWGDRPYDESIKPAENKIVSWFALGEGWHNYHHVFPWDYRAAELSFYRYNLTTFVIDFFAWIGLAYDLKSAPARLIQQRTLRTGLKVNFSNVENENKDKEE